MPKPDLPKPPKIPKGFSHAVGKPVATIGRPHPEPAAERAARLRKIARSERPNG